MNIVSKKVKELRESKELTQKQLASELQISQQTLSALENGKTAFTEEYIVQFAKYFNVSADYLLGLSDVSTSDKDLQFVCDYTGLSEDTIDFFAYTNKSQENSIFKPTSEFLEYLIKELIRKQSYIFDIEDIKKYTVELYNHYSKSHTVKLIDKQDKTKVTDALRVNMEEYKTAKPIKRNLNASMYSFNNFLNSTIKKFALSELSNVTQEDFANIEKKFTMLLGMNEV